MMKVDKEKCKSDCLHHQEGDCDGVDEDEKVDCDDFKLIPKDYDGHEKR